MTAGLLFAVLAGALWRELLIGPLMALSRWLKTRGLLMTRMSPAHARRRPARRLREPGPDHWTDPYPAEGTP